jgi:hypothetical protein
MCQNYINYKCIKYFFFLGRTRILTQNIILVRQTLYWLSQTSRPIYSGYFGYGVWGFCPGWPGTGPSYLKLPTISGVEGTDRPAQPLPHWDQVSPTFLLGLAWCPDSPNLSLPNSCEPPVPDLLNIFKR